MSIKKIGIWMALVIGMGLSANATDRYVSLSGTHQTPFTNLVTAATNIQSAVNVAVNGEIVWVSDGKYVLTNQISITKGITLKGLSGTKGAIIDGGFPSTTNRCFYINNANALIDGLTITNGYLGEGGTGGGIHIDGNGSVINCLVTGNHQNGGQCSGGGISVNGNGIVSNCQIIANGSSWNNGGWGGNVSINGGIVRNCLIRGGNAANDGGGGHGGGVSLWWGGNGLLENSIIESNTESGVHVADGTVRGCLIRNNSAGVGGGIAAKNGAKIESCTIVNNYAAGYGQPGGLGGGIYCAETNVVVLNCIIISNTTWSGSYKNYFGFYNDPTNNFTNICYSSTTPLPSGGIGNTTAYPIFLNMISNNFHLATNSPCINTGTNQTWMTNAFDLDGMSRINGGRVDMGAYEARYDSDEDGLPDWWELQYFGNITNATINADPNYNGRSNLQEYLSGSNPTNLVALGDRYVSLTGFRQPPYTNWWGASTNIQLAINAAVDGETIWVGPGTYVGSNNVNLDFGGKNLILKSSDGANTTIIDAQYVSESRGINFHSSESSNSIVDGFTFKNGSISAGAGGGGIYCYRSSPTIQNCIFSANYVNHNGAGILSDTYSSPTIKNCIFTGNYSQWGGAGVSTWTSAKATVIGCSFYGNNEYWGAMYFRAGTTGIVYSCTVASNSASYGGGGGIFCESGATLKVVDSIVFGNTGPSSKQIDATGDVQVSYSCVQGGFTGQGNMNTNPLFASGYRLTSSSPCIDKGTNMAWMVGSSDMDRNLRIANGTVDMGAYELGFYMGIQFSAVDLTWNSASGVTYQVQSCIDLISPSWTNVGSSVTATGTSSYVTDWIRNNQRKFYRVLVP